MRNKWLMVSPLGLAVASAALFGAQPLISAPNLSFAWQDAAAAPDADEAPTDGESTDRPRARLTDAERVDLIKAQDARLVAIAERLVIAGQQWCDAGHSLGWMLSDLGQYPKNVRQIVRRSHNLSTSTGLFVSAVAPGGAAAQAGIQPGQTIVSINGQAPMRYTGDNPSSHALRATQRTISEALTENGGQISVMTLDNQGVRRAVDVRARRACPGNFLLLADDMEQAYADGKDVMVTLGMARFTITDDELAGVVAHEIAHNVLQHMDRQDVHGIPSDYTRHLTVNARVLRGMEEESDRLSVWLLGAAGFNPEAPIGFWERFGPGHNSPHPLGRLHDPWQMRVASLRDEVAHRRQALTRNRAARPGIIDVARREIEELRRREAAEAAANGAAASDAAPAEGEGTTAESAAPAPTAGRR